MTADPLVDWWRYTVTVERFTGTSPSGDTYAAGTSEVAFIDDSRKLVRQADGGQVISSTQVFLPSTVAYVPAGSRVTLPATFGTPPRRSIVLASSVHAGGGQPTPDHVELALQ